MAAKPSAPPIATGPGGTVAPVPSPVVAPPDEVRLLSGAHAVELDWTGERQLRFGFAELRRRCRCADCTARRRSGFVIEIADDIAVIGINPIGTSALQFVFSDGHDRGIFPWPYLVALAEAASDTGSPSS